MTLELSESELKSIYVCRTKAEFDRLTGKPEISASAEITTASKELVDWLLERNIDNRNIRKNVVEKYLKDIKAGNWQLTNQGIGLSDTGMLIDGQHRLTAIREAGYPPVQLLIVRGLKEEARLCVDVHAKRTMRDMLAFAFKERVALNAPAICRALIRNKNSWKLSSTTVNEVLEIMEEHREEIDAITSAPQKATFFAAAFLAGFVFVAKETGRIDDVVEFMIQTEEGVMLEKDMPAYHLRNVVNDRSGSSGPNLGSIRFAKAVRATRAFLSGQPMRILRAN